MQNYILFPSLQVANSHNWQGGQIYIAPTVFSMQTIIWAFVDFKNCIQGFDWEFAPVTFTDFIHIRKRNTPMKNLM